MEQTVVAGMIPMKMSKYYGIDLIRSNSILCKLRNRILVCFSEIRHPAHTIRIDATCVYQNLVVISDYKIGNNRPLNEFRVDTGARITWSERGAED
jgi:hypothetical protein